jgi:hypothetical protein
MLSLSLKAYVNAAYPSFQVVFIFDNSTPSGLQGGELCFTPSRPIGLHWGLFIFKTFGLSSQTQGFTSEPKQLLMVNDKWLMINNVSIN